MDAARDLYVGITLKDEATPGLRLVDGKVDKIVTGFNQLGSEVDDAGDEIKSFGRIGTISADRVDDAIEKLGNSFAEMSAEIVATTQLMVSQLDRVEKKADDAGDEIRHIGTLAMASAIKVGILGGALTAAFSGGVAAAAPLLAIIGTLIASIAVASAGFVAFGAVATSALKPVFEDAENLTKAQQKARSELEGFQNFWGDFTKQFQTPILETFSTGLKMAQSVLKGMAPTISKVADVVNGLFTEMNNAVDAGGLKSFFNWMQTNAARSLDNFAHIAGNALAGVFNLFKAFTPLSSSMEEGLLSLTDRFKQWSSNLSQSTGFQKFVDYAVKNGPVLMSTLGNIVKIIGDVVVALAPLGSVVLNGLNLLTEKISEFSPKLNEINTFFKENKGLLTEVGIAIGVFAGVIGTVIGVIKIITAVQWAWNVAMTANPIGLVIAGIAALIAIGVVLYRNWDTIKTKAVELWDKLGVFKIGILAMLGPIGLLIAAGVGIYKNWGTIKEKVGIAIGAIKGWIDGLVDKWNTFKNALSNFKMPKIGLPKWAGGNGLIQTNGSHATGLERVPFDGYTATVHKDESILTAKQSNALRDAGILRNNGGKPVLDMQASNTSSNTLGSGISVGDIIINVAGGSDSKQTALDIRAELEAFFASLGRRMPKTQEL